MQVNIELKSATEKLKGKTNKDPHGFRRLLTELHSKGPFEVKIEERTQRQVQKYDYHPIVEIESAYLTDSRTGDRTMDFLSALLLEIPLPYFTAIRKIDRTHVIDLSKDKAGTLVKEIVDIMKTFHPLVAFVNGDD